MAHVATARTKARKRALDLLFAAEARGLSAGDLLDQQIAEGQVPNNPFTVKIVRGVVTDAERIDALITAFAKDWSLTRMPAVDRNVLRIGVWELLDGDVASEVAISEATALVTELSTDDSPSFVNGVLAAVAKDLARA
ncbi:N utilization substance protein B [Nocardioides luteus]|uniref:Transcription antitermination protein NusB n=1 Tax=Nocardioides luteus TaxID=1844 RepID=A0ABQ5T0V1_9ACTN|nr:transcription antitermination factor NusB [Nocardioides luteus]MDR7310858.1 N utilization substance protein B [Nocardioides luteus]GGR40169.1 N utilization substance protein B [Nocardioides luteus]GLJ69362.1 N utilization substance protein B [Nocardioides luteus]